LAPPCVIWSAYPAFFLAMILTTLGKYAFEPTSLAYLGIMCRTIGGLAMGITEFGGRSASSSGCR
jgi:hypothetical protein